MATITIKNIPELLYTQLKDLAEVNRRSVNNEVIISIERRVASYKPSPDELLRKARALRTLTIDHPISNEELDAAIEAGRP